MNNVTFIEVESITGELIEHAIIDRGNGEFSSMPKEYYDAQVAAQAKNGWTEPQLTKF